MSWISGQPYNGPYAVEDQQDDAPVSLVKGDPEPLDLGWVELS